MLLGCHAGLAWADERAAALALQSHRLQLLLRGSDDQVALLDVLEQAGLVQQLLELCGLVLSVAVLLPHNPIAIPSYSKCFLRHNEFVCRGRCAPRFRDPSKL